ncbi:hypothetical protein [Actinosynnema mirum]|uniref:Uncharacterized protein n=1 Tax=Actinosynnema mirum (strain ATCC 29888 / DSM 43827 / JCM 3225 / NBRC 14064 / NCIMB 13271 / NRRL B-12336 / IMRU 3971 / 101) TaxID=446462 RepID=C6WBK9_ACTMD|nr:hypothetical protein [Actinosynnema mirum]ACU35577.1 hypothetical protein Amir_1628 [Actinosynnema mirum DSM 43827]
MVDQSWPWDGQPTYQDRWRALSRAWTRSGLVAGTGLPALGSGLQFTLPTGVEYLIGGFLYTNITSQRVVAGPTNINSLPRFHRLVMRRDFDSKSITPVVLEGAASASPVLPALTATAAVVDYPVAYAICPGSASAQNYTGFVIDAPFADYQPALHTPNITAELRRSDGAMVINGGDGFTALKVFGSRSEGYQRLADTPWSDVYGGNGFEYASAMHGWWELEAVFPTAYNGSYAGGSTRYMILEAQQTRADLGVVTKPFMPDTAAQGFGMTGGRIRLYVPPGDQFRVRFRLYSNNSADGTIRSDGSITARWDRFD